MDAQEHLQTYWYPTHAGEDNECVARLKANVQRMSLGTRIIQALPLAVACVVFLSLVLFLFEFINEPPYFSLDNTTTLATCGAVVLAVLGVVLWRAVTAQNVYLLHFTTAEFPEHLQVLNHDILGPLRPAFSDDSVEFVERLAQRTGLGDQTYFPPIFHQPELRRPTMALSREEAELVIAATCDKLFAESGIKPTEVDAVISNCSLFSCTPSISSMILNKYKMRSDVCNYSLGGMGCSAGLISIDLAKDFLNTHPNSTALVFSTENITHSLYYGNDRSRLLPYTLFRLGGAAILLTNKRRYKARALYRLETLVRVNAASDDESHHVVYQSEDESGELGIALGRRLVACVSRALAVNLRRLLPRILTYKELLLFGIDFVRRRLSASKLPPYRPNLKESVQAYCIHAGGRGVIDGIQENFGLSDEDCLPSRAALYRFGNTSSASIWYELMFIERTAFLKRGDRVLQLAFGSGLKCNSAVWEKL